MAWEGRGGEQMLPPGRLSISSYHYPQDIDEYPFTWHVPRLSHIQVARASPLTPGTRSTLPYVTNTLNTQLFITASMPWA